MGTQKREQVPGGFVYPGVVGYPWWAQLPGGSGTGGLAYPTRVEYPGVGVSWGEATEDVG